MQNMRWFAANIRTILLAFVLAVAVWISAVTSDNPDVVRTLSAVPLEVVGQAPALINVKDIPSHVEVTLRAPQSVWEQLNANENSVQATLDLAGYGSGEYSLDIQVRILVRPVQIVLVNPTTVEVQLEPIATITLPINYSLNGETAVGYQAGKVLLDPEQVTLSGPASVIKEAKRAWVPINLAGARESVDQFTGIQILDAKNSPIRDLTLAPETVHVIIPVIQQGGFRDMAVKVVVQGQVANGYRLENISVFPLVVTILSSDIELVNSLPGVLETEPLDLKDAKENISTRLNLKLPDNVTVAGSQTVLVQVGVSAIQTSLTLLSQPINIIGLPAGLAAQISPQTLDVIVSGPLPVLDTLTPQDVIVNINVSGLEPGVHQLTPKYQILVSNVLVESSLPGTVEVILFIPDTPTPTPTATRGP